MVDAHAGIDGCRAGWFAVLLRSNGNWDIKLTPTVKELLNHIITPCNVLIDIPIGLPRHSKRECDRLARSYLTRKRSSSVFSVPGRAALYAEDYRRACEINQQILGVKLSKQTWNIRNKIIEVDKLLRSSSHLKNVIRECHPEIAFWALAGKKPMNHVKRSTAGIAERLAHLKAFFPASDEVYQDALNRFARKDLAHDDIIDAIGLAVTAAYAKEIISIPVIPELDEYELPMEIVYGDFTADE